VQVVLSGFMLATIIITAGFIGYFYYESNIPGNFTIAVYSFGNDIAHDAFANSTILQVLANFTEIQVHSAGQSNQTGWHIIMQTASPYQSDLTSHSCRIGYACVSWTSKLAAGSYDYVKFNASNVIINIDHIGNVSYALVGGGFEPPISGASSFIVQPNQDNGLEVDLTFSSAEVYARNGYLHAISLELPRY
jgi:hypothetical protein